MLEYHTNNGEWGMKMEVEVEIEMEMNWMKKGRGISCKEEWSSRKEERLVLCPRVEWGRERENEEAHSFTEARGLVKSRLRLSALHTFPLAFLPQLWRVFGMCWLHSLHEQLSLAALAPLPQSVSLLVVCKVTSGEDFLRPKCKSTCHKPWIE